MLQTLQQQILELFREIIEELSKSHREHEQMFAVTNGVRLKSNAYQVGISDGQLVQTKGYNKDLIVLCDDFKRISTEFLEDEANAEIVVKDLFRRGSSITKFLAENSISDPDLFPPWLIVNSRGKLKPSHPSRMDTQICIKIDRLNSLRKSLSPVVTSVAGKASSSIQVQTDNSPSVSSVFTHSEDYTSVHLNEDKFLLTAIQGAVIKVLDEASISGHPDLRQDTLLEKIDSKSKRIKDLFKSNLDAYARLITSKKKGMYRLNLPE